MGPPLLKKRSPGRARTHFWSSFAPDAPKPSCFAQRKKMEKKNAPFFFFVRTAPFAGIHGVYETTVQRIITAHGGQLWRRWNEEL